MGDDVAVIAEDVETSVADDEASTSAKTGRKRKIARAAENRPMIAKEVITATSVFIASFMSTSTIACQSASVIALTNNCGYRRQSEKSEPRESRQFVLGISRACALVPDRGQLDAVLAAVKASPGNAGGSGEGLRDGQPSISGGHT